MLYSEKIGLRLSLIFASIIILNYAYGDEVLLNDGRTLTGRVISQDDNVVTFSLGSKGTVTIKLQRSDIKDIITKPLPPEEPKKETKEVIRPPQETAQPTKEEKPTGSIAIEINPMMDLNFKTKKEIYDIRENYVLQYPELTDGNYSPSEAVFGQIADNRPWWGILGLSYYGPGQRSIEGPSEESRFLANPFLLVGLDSGHALIVNDKKLKAIPIYPEPISLIWNRDRSFAKVKYNVSDFWSKQKTYHDSSVNEQTLLLVAYNARDLGFNYLYVDPEESKNANFKSPSGEAVLIQYFIHCGGSCGYPGGCNNASPDQLELQVKINKLPATLYIKLWRDKPATNNQAAGMVFVIEMI